MAITTASINLAQHQLGNHRLGPEDVKLAEDKAVQDAKADGAPGDLPYVTDYEDAGRRGDAEAQTALFKKMTPAAQAQAAQHDQNYPLVIKLLTPLADAGDVNAQLNLAGIYSFSTWGYSSKYLEPMPPALVAKFQKIFKHWPPIDPRKTCHWRLIIFNRQRRRAMFSANGVWAGHMPAASAPKKI
jgi:hypothetical protein